MLLLECLPDETLARQLGRVRRECRHLNDKGRVCTWLKKAEGLVAMIDEDPGAAQPRYLTSLRPVAEEHDIRLLHDPARRHRVIVLCPRLEEWMLGTAAHAGLSVEKFGLPARANELHREINFRVPAFVRLIAAFNEIHSPRLLHLREVLNREPE